ncbi:MAG TPA: phosphate acyltransferase PlsX [Nitrospinota bacterium]|nr:phosphate acyltransferase PlsX [Nitrospinota bacterium]
MKIAVDAMGGDNAPEAIVEGAVMASRECKTKVILIGDEEILTKELKKFDTQGLSIFIKHAPEVIGMDEAPSVALRKKKNCSIKVANEIVKNGEANAVVSAGNTGAALAASTLILRRLEGVDRPAIATTFPTSTGPTVVLDVGANVDCKPIQLFQFGIMGNIYARYILGKSRPRVGLLGIGEEDSKGNESTREAFQMFKRSSLNFIGNVEGKEVFSGVSDVIVCDGFTGNVALKTCEGLAELFGNMLKDTFSQSLKSKLAYSLIKSGIQSFRKSLDYSEYGGAPLLGVNGICIICHGSSNAKAIKNAISLAERFSINKVNLHIQEDIELNSEIYGLKVGKAKFWQQIRDSFSFTSKEEEEEEDSEP